MAAVATAAADHSSVKKTPAETDREGGRKRKRGGEEEEEEKEKEEARSRSCQGTQSGLGSSAPWHRVSVITWACVQEEFQPRRT